MKLFSFGKETQELNPKPVAPPNVGLIEYKLSTQEMDYVWTVSYTHLTLPTTPYV